MPYTISLHFLLFYLILAILKSDLYFAKSCVVHYGEEDSYRYALQEISLLYMRSLTGQDVFSLNKVENIMKVHGVSFK